MITSPFEVILTVIALSFWFLFPIGIFLSVSKLDKNTDQLISLGHLSQRPTDEFKASSHILRDRPVREFSLINPRLDSFKLSFRRFIHH